MSFIQVYHNSYNTYFRHPFGAVPCGQKIIFRIKIAADTGIESCYLRLWEKESYEVLIPMDSVESVENDLAEQVYETEYIMPGEPGLMWYYFKITANGRTFYYGNNRGELGGEGLLSDHEPASYQITVYHPASVPQWYKEGIMYQIYVDRFYNGNENGEILNVKPRSLLHGHWDDTPFYIKNKKGEVIRWNFFGGNLRGVIAKLPYLKELGISIIYFNPIFEAASNHKYDTGDYHKIDAMYGDEAIFAELMEKANEIGIEIIFDGVFSHTGSDSIYFNKYGNYPGKGAYQSYDSPYFNWYRVQKCYGKYECWWGVGDLPNVNEMEPSYLDFIIKGENSVVKHWMGQGIKGWRLDVVDELPDEFVKELRRQVKETDPDAVLIGEVWEDASRKISYDKRREYFWGDELDATMNYPLRTMLLDYILGKQAPREICHRMMSLYENYPQENFRGAMNIIGSHDRIRVLTLLGDAPPAETLSERKKENHELSPEDCKKALARLRILSLLQITLPGVPCIYYGDEVGVEGYADPYNRKTYPWGRENEDLLDWYKRLIRLRREYQIFNDGNFLPFCAADDVLGFVTKGEDEAIIVCVNRNLNHSTEVTIDIEEELWRDIFDLENMVILELLSGEIIKQTCAPGEHFFKLNLEPLEGKVLYFNKKTAALCAPLDRSCGILMHPTSLPSERGSGDIGPEARNFVDFLAKAGHGLWQVLPLNPTGLGNSPYQSSSVFAGNTSLISIGDLAEVGLLDGQEAICGPGEGVKNTLLRKAFANFSERLEGEPDSKLHQEFQSFLKENDFWLNNFCLYRVLAEHFAGVPWYRWEESFADRVPEQLAIFREKFQEEIRYHCFLQYIFYSQWQRLKEYANSKGVKIIGDLPIYVSGDSCDTWSNRDLFLLDDSGRPSLVAGVPPDYFSETGQLWGNPLYNWKSMERDDFSWWKKRIGHALKIYDYIRLDHFRGFESYWEIPADEDTAVNGRWIKGPGKRFFEALAREFGELPLIAEDLGFITPEVHNLKNILGFPGMKVLQFELNEVEEKVHNTVFYTGTHDNDTLVGWYKEGRAGKHKSESELRDHIWQRYITRLYAGQAPWVIMPLQDALGLGSEARMNVPGTVGDNWSWQLKKGDLTADLADKLKKIARESGRI